MSVNKVILIGRLGRDPETRGAVTSFGLATSEKYKDEVKTEWHNCVAFGKTGELCSKYLKKGSEVYLEGKIQTSKYEKDGEKKQRTEIVVFQVSFLSKQQGAATEKQSEEKTTIDDNDNIPF